MPDRLTAVLEAVALAAERLLAAPSWEEGIQEVLARLGEAALVSRAYVFENAGSGEGLRSVLRHEWTAPGVPPEKASGPASTSYGGFERWVRELARGETVHGHVQDFPPSERPLLERLGVRSIAVAPVFVGSRWWGVLGFDDCSGDRDWSGPELDALRAAARMIGAAVQRGRSQDALVETGQRLRAQNAFLEALHETTLGLINRLDAQEVVEAIVTRAAALVGTEHGYLYQETEEGDELEVRVGVGVFSEWLGFRLKRGEGMAGKVWQSGEPLWLDDYDRWEGRSEAFPVGVFRAVVGLPLTSGDRVVGVIGLSHLDPERVFTEEDVALLSRFGELASVALDNARLYTGAQQELEDRRRAEQALRFQAYLLDHVENAVVATDAGDAITYWNAFAERLFGWTAAEALGRRFREVVPIAPELAQEVNAAIGDGRAWEGDAEVRHRGGSRFVAFFRVTPMRGPDGKPDGVVGVGMDVTDRRRAEEALRDAYRREREVTQRLRALDEMKNTFLQAVSHELRTPLSAIFGLALTLERHLDSLSPERSLELIGRLAVNARKLDRLLSDLLDLDRLSRGIVEPRRRSTDILALVEQVVASTEVAGNRPIEIVGSPVSASVDGAKVERIVENLVANAARHTPEGTPIWVRVEPHEDGIVIAVEDAGPGVPADLSKEVFEPFRQGPGVSSHSPGVGIGLSLVARFAELHGGRAWVQEREGGGASFRVLLPGGPPWRSPAWTAAGEGPAGS